MREHISGYQPKTFGVTQNLDPTCPSVVQKRLPQPLYVERLLSDVRETEESENWIALARGRLALRRAEKPATKAGQIRALWPEIAAALAGGQSMKSIRKWLEEDAGIALAITSLTSYISRIRRRERAARSVEGQAAQSVRVQTRAEPAREQLPAHAPSSTPRQTSPATTPPEDPLAQAMRALSKRAIDIREIHSDGDPHGRKLI